MEAAHKWEQKWREIERLYPWYRDLTKDRTIRSLEDLPFMTAPLLEARYYRQPPPDDPAISVYRTSGTSAKGRKTILYSLEDDDYYVALKQKLFADILNGTQITKAVSDMGTGHAASTAGAIFAAMGIDYRIVPFEEPLETHIALLESYRPELLYTMPSILERIVQGAREPRAFGLRKIILVGEVASSRWIANMAAAFGLSPVDVTDTYGSIELGTMAYYSHANGRYFLEDTIIAETAQPQDLGLTIDPLREDEAILVLTSMNRRYFPALRFVTYDVVRGFRPAAEDGSVPASFESIVKRVGPEFKHGEKMSIHDIEEVVGSLLPDAIARVAIAGNKLCVTVSSAHITEEAIIAIKAGLREQIPEIGLMIRNRLLEDIEVETQPYGEPGARKGIKEKKLRIEEPGS
ncbi:AMP-binding protein [Paenibacillus sp. MBLB4367]|uniref:AMP-binding protein n=1 Tax=Paenibacillus sp. MBLB4367 TaxID=3384767 RepID=UPI0039080AC2